VCVLTASQKGGLGPYAFEEQMPVNIATLLAKENDTNNIPGVMRKILCLLQNDPNVELAYLCDQSTIQVFKLDGEGNHFCGYRNIQMLCLAVGSTISFTAPARSALKDKLPIPQIQDMVEAAWDRNINSHGKKQTGGIKGTRKHIGGLEAEALLLSLNVPCTGSKFSGNGAWSDLLDFVEAYYSHSIPAKHGVQITSRPPIFLQRPQHSITIVGFERTKAGGRRLLAFDPAWAPPGAMRKEWVGDYVLKGWEAKWVLRQYRKNERYLKRFGAFETVSVDLLPRHACWR
jgi:zinc finger-containing ubiquitin peptidase 1